MNWPVLHLSDRYIENFYKYRWENIKELSFKPNGKIYQYAGVYEGYGYFQKHISYSAAAHMRELRWLSDPSLARGSILNFIANQKNDGSFPGHLGPETIDEESFYHADWGAAVLELHKIHPNIKFLKQIYLPLIDYAQYFERERDREKCFLYDVWNHYETGQEFSSRYTAIDPLADRNNWGKIFRLKGVDATTYIYNLWTALAEIAGILGKNSESVIWAQKAQKTKKAVLQIMWDKKNEMFFDVNPQNMQRTSVKSLTCFYPYMTDIVSRKHLAGLRKHLLNPKEFWTAYPFPTLSLDDPNFSADGIWRGKKEACPWNGRVWPMANSHMAEVMARCAIRFQDKEFRQKFEEFFNRWIKMMFFEGDPEKPNSFEHYHPFDGSPSTKENGFSGINDYLHSWINDLIIKYAAGFGL